MRLALLLAALLATAPARADVTADKAAQHFAKAEKAEAKGDWKKAIAEYRAAYKLRPHASVLYNVARMEAKLGELLAAADDYQRYLDSTPEAKDAAEVTTRIAKLRDEAGRKIIASAILAKGGAERLKGVRSLASRGSFTVSVGPAQPTRGEFKRLIAGTDRSRVEMTFPNGTREVQIITPESAYGASAMEQDDARAALWRDKDLVLNHVNDEGVVVRATGADAVSLELADGKWRTKLVFDRKTHFLVAAEYDTNGGAYHVDLGDYRKIDGIFFAHRVVNQAGGKTMVVSIEELTVNPPVPPETFQK